MSISVNQLYGSWRACLRRHRRYRRNGQSALAGHERMRADKLWYDIVARVTGIRVTLHHYDEWMMLGTDPRTIVVST